MEVKIASVEDEFFTRRTELPCTTLSADQRFHTTVSAPLRQTLSRKLFVEPQFFQGKQCPAAPSRKSHVFGTTGAFHFPSSDPETLGENESQRPESASCRHVSSLTLTATLTPNAALRRWYHSPGVFLFNHSDHAHPEQHLRSCTEAVLKCRGTESSVS